MEKTCLTAWVGCLLKKHLHERGEDANGAQYRRRGLETPPRAWRRPRGLYPVGVNKRNTSTSVEKTPTKHGGNANLRKHLHERGEDVNNLADSDCILETPPRAWRRLVKNLRFPLDSGNTSTSVEKTQLLSDTIARCGKHLHERGEDNEATSPREV